MQRIHRPTARTKALKCPMWVKDGRSQHVRNESAYPPIAAEEQTSRLVGSVPLADSCTAADSPLFDHSVGEGKHSIGFSRRSPVAGLTRSESPRPLKTHLLRPLSPPRDAGRRVPVPRRWR